VRERRGRAWSRRYELKTPSVGPVTTREGDPLGGPGGPGVGAALARVMEGAAQSCCRIAVVGEGQPGADRGRGGRLDPVPARRRVKHGPSGTQLVMDHEIRALALVCSLKPGPQASSSEVMARQVLDAMADHGVAGDTLRVADYDVKPGTAADMGEGDQWPQIRSRIYDADILVFATPTWVGHPSSVAQRVLERLDAELSETDDQGRPELFGKVAVVAVVGNEDGAHKIVADSFQALNDMGFTIPAGGATYWNSEAMNPVDYKDLDQTPEPVAATTATLGRNAAHLARVLGAQQYPAS
jgi:multimeric flavodoxin WrbA